MEDKLIEPSLLSSWIVENSSIWQNNFQDPLRISHFFRERNVRFWEPHIFLLWDLGWVRAEFVQAKKMISIKDIDLLETNSEGDSFYADNRLLNTTKTLSDVPIRQYYEETPDIVPCFHPFKYYVFWHIQRYMQLNISQYQIMNPVKYPELLDIQIKAFQAWTLSDSATEQINRWDEIARLAIITEPCYYPEVIGTFTWPYPFTQEEQFGKIQSLKIALKEEYLEIGLQPIKDIVGELCTSADMIEPNKNVHSLMRFIKGKRRQQLTGNLGAALLLKAMAEIIRRMAEETFAVQLPEEDEVGIGEWVEGAKQQFYGSHRIFDEGSLAKRDFLRSMGLDAEVRTHMYVEGLTEYSAFNYLLDAWWQIEIFDLRGRFLQSDYLAFQQNIIMDDKNHVFSFIILDGDVSDNIRVVRKAAGDDLFCGTFFVSHPDFEFNNFSKNELAIVAWGMLDDYQKSMLDYQTLFEASQKAKNAKEFFKIVYKVDPQLSQIQKGGDWGKALAQYAAKYPTIDGSATERPFITSVQTAIRSVNDNYRFTREKSRVDPVTGKLIPRL